MEEALKALINLGDQGPEAPSIPTRLAAGEVPDHLVSTTAIVFQVAL
jgi:hypothetical protein